MGFLSASTSVNRRVLWALAACMLFSGCRGLDPPKFYHNQEMEDGVEDNEIVEGRDAEEDTGDDLAEMEVEDGETEYSEPDADADWSEEYEQYDAQDSAPEHHESDAGDGLGHGVDAEDGVGPHGLAGLHVHHPHTLEVGQLAVPGHCCDQAGDLALIDVPLHGRVKPS